MTRAELVRLTAGRLGDRSGVSGEPRDDLSAARRTHEAPPNRIGGASELLP